MGDLINNGGVTHADADALPMLEYDDVVRCLSDADERSSCYDFSYSEAGIGLNRGTAHPAGNTYIWKYSALKLFKVIQAFKVIEIDTNRNVMCDSY